MDKNRIVITMLLTASVLILVIPAVIFIIRRIIRSSDITHRKTRTSRVFVVSACLIASIWCVRYAVGFYNIITATEQTLTWWEEIINSIVHTLQTISMDEDYVEYILVGKKMIQYVAGNDSAWPGWYGIYASLLNLIAPVAGGAVLFEILASVFPKVRLHFSHMVLFKAKYYFSELNSASLALAKSIYETKTNRFKKPVLIFTDTYFDDEDEKGSELILEAKLAGAICVRDDLSHVRKNRFGKRKFFLIDENDAGNLQTLTELANSGNIVYLKNSEIYLFTSDDAYVRVEQILNRKFEEKFTAGKRYVRFTYCCERLKALFLTFSKKKKSQSEAKTESEEASEPSSLCKKPACAKIKKIFVTDKKQKEIIKKRRVEEYKAIRSKLTGERLPVIIPVNSYRNLIANLLTDIPLYEPIVGKKRDSEGKQNLNVTILGAGNIGTEMFLSAYWFGQILDCKLNINILSQEEEAVFWNKIDYINPEIKHTTIKDDPILLYNREGDKSDEYCNVRYIQCDVKSSEFIKCMREPERQILDTDYFFVSIGTDEDNISVANTIRRYVSEHHINKKSQNRVVVTYVVYNPELVNTLNQEKYFKYNKDTVDVYMQAVGSLNEVYDINNICMTKHESFAQKVQDAYDTMQNCKARVNKHRARLKNDYKHWATLAQAMHIKYRMYSMGLINISMFDYPDSEKEFTAKLNQIYENYQKLLSGKSPRTKEELNLLHRMAWLEHRRWNAFTRVKGFRHTDNYDVYAISEDTNSYKQMDIKLHPCLVECDENGIRSGLTSTGEVDKEKILKCTDRTGFDLLDELSYDLFDKTYNNYDFKQYDYPFFDREEQ